MKTSFGEKKAFTVLAKLAFRFPHFRSLNKKSLGKPLSFYFHALKGQPKNYLALKTLLFEFEFENIKKEQTSTVT